MKPDHLFTMARAWIAADPDTQTRAAVQAILDLAIDGVSDARGELAALFDGRITFGTAGLRAPMGPGPKQMNRLVVQQTTAGLMAWLAPNPTVVIGFDARHHSEVFARDVADTVARFGGQARLLPRATPTPVLAGAVLSIGADAGVMVTASHNPKEDNGYKLYLGDGIQLVAPDDVAIADAIDRLLLTRGFGVEAAPTSRADGAASQETGTVTVLGTEMIEQHLRAVVATLVDTSRDVTTVYTAMHGVGGAHLVQAMHRAGFPAPTVVPEQFEPDPEFPTVAFPNPEEPGALDMALTLAEAMNADLVLANDPDADRLAIAIPGRGDSAFVALSGDELGVLLADHLLRHTSGARQVAMSLVSSRLLARMAASADVGCSVTMTGFKWVARPIVDRPELDYILGYEEAIGYCLGGRSGPQGLGTVRDKDGISAALVACEMTANAIANDESLWHRLDRLAIMHGLHMTRPVSVRLDGPDGVAQREAMLARILTTPPPTLLSPASGRQARLVGVTNLAAGERYAPTPGVVLDYDDDTRVIVRPSGTEPKLKAYIEVIEPVQATTGDASIDSTSRSAEQAVASARAVASLRLAVVGEQVAALFTV